MNRKACLFARGQIWYLKRDTNEVTPHVMESKDRYYLVVSCKENNENAPIANVCVISSKDYDHRPMHVKITMPSGKFSIVECEHIYTKSITKFQEGEYVGTVPEHVMNEVTVTLANQLGLTSALPGVNAIMDMVSTIAEKKQKELASKSYVTDDMVLSVCKRISDMFDVALTKTSNNIPETTPKVIDEVSEEKSVTQVKSKIPKSSIDKFNERLKKSQEIITKSPGRNKWNDETIKIFLQDCDNLPMNEVVAKYGFKNIKSAYQTKYIFTNRKCK